MATYQVIDFVGELDRDQSIIHEEQENLRIEIALDRMSPSEKTDSAEILKRILSRLEKSS